MFNRKDGDQNPVPRQYEGPANRYFQLGLGRQPRGHDAHEAYMQIVLNSEERGIYENTSIQHEVGGELHNPAGPEVPVHWDVFDLLELPLPTTRVDMFCDFWCNYGQVLDEYLKNVCPHLHKYMSPLDRHIAWDDPMTQLRMMSAQVKAYGFRHGILPPYNPGACQGRYVFQAQFVTNNAERIFARPSLFPTRLSFVDWTAPQWLPHVPGRSALHPKPGTRRNLHAGLGPNSRYSNRQAGEDARHWRPGTFKTEVAGAFDFFGVTGQERFCPATAFNEYPSHPQHLDHSGDGKGCKLDIPCANDERIHDNVRVNAFDMSDTECHRAGSSKDAAPVWERRQVRTSATQLPSINTAIYSDNNMKEENNYRPDSWTG